MMPGDFSRSEIESLIAGYSPGSSLVDYRALEGGVSAKMAVVELRTAAGGTERLVARVHGGRELANNPELPEHECRLLALLQEHGIPVPRPLGVDRESGAEPVVLLEFLDGVAMNQPQTLPTDPPGAGLVAARVLRRIHQLDIGEFDFLPDGMAIADGLVAESNPKPNEAFMEQTLGEALARHWPPARVPKRLLHGDYWPGNLMFRDDEFQAVLDWEEAVLGDPLMDVAIARVEISWMWGKQACDAFTAGYCPADELDEARLAIWDLFAAFRMARGIPWWGFDETDWQLAREGHAAFAALALEKLGED